MITGCQVCLDTDGILYNNRYVEQQVLNTLRRNKMEEMCRLIQDSAGIAQWAATRGFVFEAVAHRVIAKGGNITVCFDDTLGVSGPNLFS